MSLTEKRGGCKSSAVHFIDDSLIYLPCINAYKKTPPLFVDNGGVWLAGLLISNSPAEEGVSLFFR